jgi:nucleoside-diphosphate-sugar epimerase
MFFMSSIKKNILLVGGAGYIGSALGKKLSENYTIFSTSRHGEGIQLDMQDEKTFTNILAGKPYDCVVLLASTLNGLGTAELKKEYLSGNTLGIASFLQFIGDEQLTRKLIYISSMTVYGLHNNVPVKEDGRLEPLSTYGLGKCLAEQLVLFFCRTRAINGAILRIPGVYGGERKSGFVYQTVAKCKRNEPVFLDTSSLGYWETIHIDDLVNGISGFMENYTGDDPDPVFNLGYGIPTDIAECAFKIKELTGSSSEIQITGKKGYVEFFLDNTRIRKYVQIRDNFLSSLEKYIKRVAT